MSTVVVVKKDGYAAIGADTLTCFGSTKQSAEYIENSSKILRIGENLIALVGHASWEHVLSSYFTQRKEPPRLDSVQAIFETARELHAVLKEEYFLNPVEDKDDEFESSQLDCLIATPHGIFGLYSLRSVQEFRKFYAFGRGADYALGAMYAVYDTAASAEVVARAGLGAGVEFDDSTGLPIQVHTIELKR